MKRAFRISTACLAGLVLWGCHNGSGDHPDSGPGGPTDASTADAAGSTPDGGANLPDGNVTPSDASAADAGADASTATGGDGGTGPVLFPARDFICPDPTTIPSGTCTDCSACTTTQPATSDAARTVTVPMGMADTTKTYVLSTISMPVMSSGDAAGFNLDGLDSGIGSSAATADCQNFQPDFHGVVDSNEVGVDNALQGLVPTVESIMGSSCAATHCLDTLLQNQVNGGTFLLLIEVSGINDYNYDPDVSLQLFAGQVPGGGAPMLGSGGTIAPGQSFNTMSTLGSPVSGDIFQGRLRAQPSTMVSLSLAGDLTTPVSPTVSEIRFDIAADGLSNGVIGGSHPLADFAGAADAASPGSGSSVRSVLQGYADLDPSSADPTTCQSISLGLTFDATTAIRN